MKSFSVPAMASGLFFIGALWNAVQIYQETGALSTQGACILIAAIAVGVLTVRLWETEKKLDQLLQKSENEQETGEKSDEQP